MPVSKGWGERGEAIKRPSVEPIGALGWLAPCKARHEGAWQEVAHSRDRIEEIGQQTVGGSMGARVLFNHREVA